MIDKKDMIDLIIALESFDKLNFQVSVLTGGSDIKNENINGLYNIYEVIKRNSKFSKEDDSDYDMFNSIIHADDKSPEEKYNLIKA